jgi:hypothetical protein
MRLVYNLIIGYLWKIKPLISANKGKNELFIDYRLPNQIEYRNTS